MSENPPEDESPAEHSDSVERASSWFDEETRMQGDSENLDNDEDVTDLQPPRGELDPDFDVNFDPLEDRKPGEPPFRQFDKYKLLDKIGQGGMGVVYEAFDTEMERSVALKLMRVDRSESQHPAERERFKQEAKTAGSLGHVNIVTVHAVGEHNNCLFIDMALIKGETLSKYVERQRAQGMFNTKRIVDIALQIARGLKAAHDQGIIHRDIKPGNILIDQDGNVKIVDFGLARRSDGSHITTRNVTLGTPNFMSPEQARGSSDLDARSDLFSLGAVLFFMCSGHFPFQAEDHMAVMYRVTHDPHQPLKDLEPDLPQDLCDLVDRLLAKDRAKRVDSAATVAADLVKIEKLLDSGHSDAVETVTVAEPSTAPLSPLVFWGSLATIVGVLVAALLVNLPKPRATTAPPAPGTVPNFVVPDSSRITVGKGGDLASITAALRQISSGGLVSIVGAVTDKTPIKLTAKHSGIKIVAEVATVVPIIEIDECTNVLIENLTILCEPNQHAIRVRGDCEGSVFRNIRIQQAREDIGSSAAAVLLQDVKGTNQSPIVFDRCQIDCFKTGLTILAQSTNCRWITVKDCNFVGAGLEDGIHILLEGNPNNDTTVDLVTVTHNRFAKTATGIRMSYAMGADIDYNTFLDLTACCVSLQLESRVDKVVVEHNLALDNCARLVVASVGVPQLIVQQNLATEILNELGVHRADVEVNSKESTHADYMLPVSFPEILNEWDVDYVGARPLRKNSPPQKSQQL